MTAKMVKTTDNIAGQAILGAASRTMHIALTAAAVCPSAVHRVRDGRGEGGSEGGVGVRVGGLTNVTASGCAALL